MDPLADNPFFVLELSPTATAMEIERQGKMLIAKLELGLAAARLHPSPFGPRPRTADDVRRAMQTLADPRRRLAAEPFAALPLAALSTPTTEATTASIDTGPVVEVGSLMWWRP